MLDKTILTSVEVSCTLHSQSTIIREVNLYLLFLSISVTSVSSEIAPPGKADYSSIGIDSDDEIQEGNFFFSLVFRPVQGSTSGSDKTPQ